MLLEVDRFIANANKWKEETIKLRSIALSCGLTETFKWKSPCYEHNEANIAIIGHFKDYCGFSFFNGSLLSDSEKILVSPGENSRYSRLIKFTTVDRIYELESTLKAYIFEAIEIEKIGIKVETKPEMNLPDELVAKFKSKPDFKTAFEALTQGRQRGYLLHFNGVKQAKTRISRIEKYEERILKGFGFHDCICGLSKRMPTCDGSHKALA